MLALRLHELTGWPLVGLYEGTELHHVAVGKGDEVLDADGLSSKTERAKRFSKGAGKWKKITEKKILEGGLPGWEGYTDEELDEVDVLAIEVGQIVGDVG